MWLFALKLKTSGGIYFKCIPLMENWFLFTTEISWLLGNGSKIISTIFAEFCGGGDSISMKTIRFWNMKKYKDRKITPPTRVKWKIKKYIYGYSYFMTSWYIETKNMIFQILCFFAATAAQEAHLSLYQGTKMHPFNRKLVSVHNRNILAVREGFKKSVSGKK